MIFLRVILLGLLFAFAGRVAGAMEVWERCVLLPWQHNDGDSFLVRTAGGEEHRIRLYFVDAPETAAEAEADRRRLREQTAYFGLESASQTIHAGREAARFTAAALSGPFTVHTARAVAPGRGNVPRLYAFVRTAEGRDLGELLVEAGHARAHGVGRLTPEGVRRDDQMERLRDLELAAALHRIGVWRTSQPELLVERRAVLRSEQAELDALKREIDSEDSPRHPVDPNRDPIEVLQTLRGIGPVLAERIVFYRPYRIADDLLRVPGIGPAVLDDIRDQLRFTDATNSSAP